MRLNPFQKAVDEIAAHEMKGGMPEHLARDFARTTLHDTCDHLRNRSPFESLEDLIRMAMTDEGLTRETARALVIQYAPEFAGA